MNREQLAIIVDRMAVNYGYEVDEPLLDLWWDHAQNWDFEVACEAVTLTIDRQDFKPHVSIVRNYVSEVLRNRARAAAEVAPAGAYGSCALCEGYGWYESGSVIERSVQPVWEKVSGAWTSTGEASLEVELPTYKPCKNCETIEVYERWMRWCSERKRARPIQPNETLDYNPQAVIADARILLGQS